MREAPSLLKVCVKSDKNRVKRGDDVEATPSPGVPSADTPFSFSCGGQAFSPPREVSSKPYPGAFSRAERGISKSSRETSIDGARVASTGTLALAPETSADSETEGRSTPRKGATTPLPVSPIILGTAGEASGSSPVQWKAPG